MLVAQFRCFTQRTKVAFLALSTRGQVPFTAIRKDYRSPKICRRCLKAPMVYGNILGSFHANCGAACTGFPQCHCAISMYMAQNSIPKEIMRSLSESF